jgi:hypothetical protein
MNNIPLATEEETQQFLQRLWFDFGMRIVRSIATAYSLSEEQHEALKDVLLKPNNWDVKCKPPIA